MRTILALILGLLITGSALAVEPFVISDIRVDGLQRISEGTVFNYLPVNVGETLDDRRLEEAFRAVYSTGFFADVEFRRDGDTLVIAAPVEGAGASFLKITYNWKIP